MNSTDSHDGIPGLRVPEVNAESHREQLKITLFNSRKSAALTVWLVAVPCFFLFAVTMKHYFRYDLGIFTIIEEFVSSIDRDAHFPLSAVLLVGFPLIGLAINLLSILHVAIEPARKEMVITMKLRWVNILLSVLTLAIVSVFMIYALIENIHHSFPAPGV
jgi:hypothetical protein